MGDPNRLCFGCMQETEDTRYPCLHCGFVLSEYEKERSARALLPGTVLNGKYILGRVIGEGGFGITYIALDLYLDVVVAIKEYYPVGLASRDTTDGSTDSISVLAGEKRHFFDTGLKRFADEAKKLVKFRSLEGVVSVQDFFNENATAYMVMEYIKGRTLKQYLDIRGEPLSEEETLRIMKPVLQALYEIHRTGVIHRDISPENIMLGDDGQICLIDFGAARMAAGSETKSITVLLKHGYAPVEQYQMKGRQGPWTDVYAVCATMYRMVSGRKPMEAVERMVEDRLVPLSDIPGIEVSEHFSQMVEKGMAVSMKDRSKGAGELLVVIGSRLPDEKPEEKALSEAPEGISEEEYSQEYVPAKAEARPGLKRNLIVIGLLILCLMGGMILLSAVIGNDVRNELERAERENPKTYKEISMMEISEVPSAAELAESLEEQDSFFTFKRHSVSLDNEMLTEWEFQRSGVNITIIDDGNGGIGEVYWYGYPYLSFQGIAVGLERETVERACTEDKEHEGEENQVWYKVGRSKEKKFLVIRYDKEDRVERLHYRS